MNYDQWKLDTPDSYDEDDIKYIICPNCDGGGHFYFDEDNDVLITVKVYDDLTSSQKSFCEKFECDVCEAHKEIDENEEDSFSYDKDVVRCSNDSKLDYLKPSLSNDLSDLELLEKEVA